MKTSPFKLAASATLMGILLLCSTLRAQEPEVRHNYFVPLADKGHAPRVLHTLTRLANGRILLAGGFRSLSGLLPLGNKEIEVFDPTHDTFRMVADLSTIRIMHTATLLPDGRVLFIGGTPSTVVEAFDARTGQVSKVGNILTPRGEHAATLLDDGRIFITGGLEVYLRYRGGEFKRKMNVVAVTEVFNPDTGKSEVLKTYIIGRDGHTSTPRLIRRRGHTQTLLPGGKVLIVGGDWPGACLLLDPKSGEVTIAGRLTTPREDHRATLLADGRVLITGGSSKGRTLDTAEIYDPTQQKFVRLASRMSAGREDHTATALADGRVLLTGGEDNQAGPDKRDVILSSADIFDPKQDVFVKLKGLGRPRDDHRAALLKDGRVLIFGGQTTSEAVLDTGELFVP